jgi:dephospho-CoA kinase
VVVLTGGIASGKTAVSDRFAALGVPVIDTDRIAHQIVEPGKPALQQIAETFGSEFLDAEGGLHRRKMREAIFAAPALKKRLEGILHPIIAEEALSQVRAAQGPYCILVIPLYTKSARWPFIDRVLVVDVDEDTQIKRVMARDHIDRAQAEAILRAQSSRQQRLELANDVIDNSGNLAQSQEKVEALHQKYLTLARKSGFSRDQ